MSVSCVSVSCEFTTHQLKHAGTGIKERRPLRISAMTNCIYSTYQQASASLVEALKPDYKALETSIDS